jgi:hypothetical protein
MRASIEKLSAHIQSQPHLDALEKEELLQLLADIESEVQADASGDPDLYPVRESMDLTADSAPESLPTQLEENLLKIEATYPKTAAALGRIADVLSRMGI